MARAQVTKHLFVLVITACSSKPEPAPVEKATGEKPAEPSEQADPWQVGDKPVSPPGPAAGNINKLVIGGDNTKPQMGLFALKPDDAKRVDAEMDSGLEAAYRLAEKLAVGRWTGDRTFCEDSVRLRLGYFGMDGGMTAEKRQRWRTKKLADVMKRDSESIYSLHLKMIGEQDKAACDKSIATYVAGITLAAKDDLELRNFGY
jgi:hypothetical protein